MAEQLRENDSHFWTKQDYLEKYVDYDGGAYPVYIGYAMPGTATSAAGWQIRKQIYNLSNNVVHVVFANSTNKFNQVWDSRAALFG